MATKKRPNVPVRSSEDAQRPDSEIDVETTRAMNVDTDIEHADSGAQPAADSVESQESAYRIDIEQGGERDAGDVERGPS